MSEEIESGLIHEVTELDRRPALELSDSGDKRKGDSDGTDSGDSDGTDSSDSDGTDSSDSDGTDS